MRMKIFASLAVLIMFLLVAGCAQATPTQTEEPTLPPATSTPEPTPTVVQGPISLQFIGHSCTLITAPDGTQIISDPYGGNHPRGLAALPDNLTADVITISHLHPDHAGGQSDIKGDPKVIVKPESYQAGAVTITGYKSDHGLKNGKSSGTNTVFVFEIGDVKIVHLGGAGVVIQDDILAAMEKADVILVDIMGDNAHPLKEEIDQLLERGVRTIIPTHYSFDAKKRYYGSATLDEFLEIVPADLTVVQQEGDTLQITPDMPQQLLVLRPTAQEND